jgi:pimeloyl-ACP methyl ester carboxylesterase
MESPPASRWRSVLSFVALQSTWWERSWRHRLGRTCCYLLYCYGVILVVMLWLENWLLFQSAGASDWSAPPQHIAVEDVWLTANGTTIHGWWSAPSNWKPEQGAMLYCHGNGGNLSHRCGSHPYLVRDAGIDILSIDYPGYGKSGGKSTEAGCYAAADAAYDWLTTDRQIPGERVILCGGSLGGAVAVDVAARRPHRALLLVSTFTTFPDIAQNQYPFLPARWLVKNRFDTLGKLASCKRPTFVVHSRADGLIPFEMGKRLYEAAPEPKQFYELTNEPHHDSADDGAFRAFLSFLAEQAP